MNNDLISREALKKAACIKFYTTPYYKHILDLIDNAPTVEYPFYQEAYQTGYEEGQIERLIRCKDCKHTVLSENGKTLICCLTMRVGTVRPNFYCGNGEMKGGAE